MAERLACGNRKWGNVTNKAQVNEILSWREIRYWRLEEVVSPMDSVSRVQQPHICFVWVCDSSHFYDTTPPSYHHATSHTFLWHDSLLTFCNVTPLTFTMWLLPFLWYDSSHSLWLWHSLLHPFLFYLLGLKPNYCGGNLVSRCTMVPLLHPKWRAYRH